MTDKEKPESEPQSSEGSTSGQAVRPSSESPSPIERREGLIQEIPIGLPVSPQEYYRLKARAEQASQAQQDAPVDDANQASQAQQGAPVDDAKAP